MSHKERLVTAAASCLVLAALLFASPASAQIVGAGDLPDWEADAEIKLGWAFDTPTTPGTATPLTGWDVTPGDDPVWDYDADREMWDNPAQWHVLLTNVEDTGDSMSFMIAWVWAYVGDHPFFTNLEWDPFDSYDNLVGFDEMFDIGGVVTTDTGEAAYGRFTQTVDMYPNPDTIDVYLGVPVEATGMELVEAYVLGVTVSGSDTDTDTDSDTDTDTDSDTDTDTDSDTDTDTDSDSDSDADGDSDDGCGCSTAGNRPRGSLSALIASLL
jgi:hypothetical protein